MDLDRLFERATFRKAGGSGDLNCVEVAFVADATGVRDSKESHGPILGFTRNEWVAFTNGVRAGDFDL